MRVKSSMASFTFAAWAMARRCRTAFVEPPRAMTTVMAFSNAFRVMMSRGKTPLFRRLSTAAPASRQSAFLSRKSRLGPSCSASSCPVLRWQMAIVFAVYMPPQEPAPGMAHASISCASFSLILPAACWPTASKTETTSTIPAVKAARKNGSAVNKDGGTIQPRHGDEAARHVFVASADGDDSIEALAPGHGFDRVGNDFAGHEGVFHAFGAHRNAIRDRDRVENRALPSGIIDSRCGFTSELDRCAYCTA